MHIVLKMLKVKTGTRNTIKMVCKLSTELSGCYVNDTKPKLSVENYLIFYPFFRNYK